MSDWFLVIGRLAQTGAYPALLASGRADPMGWRLVCKRFNELKARNLYADLVVFYVTTEFEFRRLEDASLEAEYVPSYCRSVR